MKATGLETGGDGIGGWPQVTVVYLAYNRRDQLRESMRRALLESDYPDARIDAIVVDNASGDGTTEMVREEFPQVHLIVRDRNIGVSAWNEGLAAARGDYVLALDDDCYLPPDGLRRAVTAARKHGADLVSFKVVSTEKPSFAFTDGYRTGLFTFWGCAVLMRREVIDALGGYDPDIFVWANELEFMLRFFDRGFRHLHFPEVVAQHMKPAGDEDEPIELRSYCINARHFAYIAAKLLHRRDAAEALVALLARDVRDAVRERPGALSAVAHTVRGFAHGLRRRAPVKNAELSRFYRRNFETFASPWWLSRPPRELVRALPYETVDRVLNGRTRPKGIGRREQFYADRARFYPNEPATLEF